MDGLRGFAAAAAGDPLLQSELGGPGRFALLPVRHDSELMSELARGRDQCQAPGGSADLPISAELDRIGAEGFDRRIDVVDRLIDAAIDDGPEESGAGRAIAFFCGPHRFIGKTSGTVITIARAIESAISLAGVGRDIEDPNLLASSSAAVAIFLDLGCERDLAGADNHNPPGCRR